VHKRPSLLPDDECGLRSHHHPSCLVWGSWGKKAGSISLAQALHASSPDRLRDQTWALVLQGSDSMREKDLRIMVQRSPPGTHRSIWPRHAEVTSSVAARNAAACPGCWTRKNAMWAVRKQETWNAPSSSRRRWTRYRTKGFLGLRGKCW